MRLDYVGFAALGFSNLGLANTHCCESDEVHKDVCLDRQIRLSSPASGPGGGVVVYVRGSAHTSFEVFRATLASCLTTKTAWPSTKTAWPSTKTASPFGAF